MTNLTFADSHNMVAYMEKSAENVDFAEIVDFLNAIPIKYALTGTGLGSGPKHQDAILGDTPTQTRVLDLENVKDAQALDIQKLKKRVNSINLTAAEPVTTISAPVNIAGVSVSTTEPSTPSTTRTTTTTVIEDEDLIIPQTLMKMRIKYRNTRPEEAYGRVLWVDLKVMFEPDIESEVWRELQGNKVTA
nr:hypothetical protein [Tanacetum cinerariifolium]